MRKTLTLIAGFAALCAAGEATAQTTTGGSSSISIPTVLYISVSNGPTFGQPTAAEFNATTPSIASSTTATLDHRGNVQHSVLVQASSDNMTRAGGVQSAKPVTDLQLSVASGTWVPVAKNTASAGNTLVSGAAAGRHTRTISYRMLLDYAIDGPESYGASFTYTIVAQ